MPNTTTRKRAPQEKTLLRGVTQAAKEHRAALANRDHLIAVAVKYGVTQTAVAQAAGMSQAHVSRVVAFFRTQDEERKAARRARRNREGGTV